MLEIYHHQKHSLLAEALCPISDDHLIAAWFDPADKASHVFRIRGDGKVFWSRKLDNFRVKDAASITSAGGKQTVFLCGQSTINENLALEALTGKGGDIFATEYDLDPLFETSAGKELRIDRTNKQVIIVGTGTEMGTGKRQLIVTTTDLTGDLITSWAFENGVGNPQNSELLGRTIQQSIPNPNNSVVGVEIITDSLQRPGLLEITPSGTLEWSREYQASSTSFFSGNNFNVRGMDSDGKSYMVSGHFESNLYSTGQSSAYTLWVDEKGNGLRFNEYETTGAFPPKETLFRDMVFYPNSGNYFFCGGFLTESTYTGEWPGGPDPQSFWMVSSLRNGKGECSTKETPKGSSFVLHLTTLNPVKFTLPGSTISQTTIKRAKRMNAPQCPTPKD